MILETLVPDGGALSIQTLRAGEALSWSWLFPPYHWSFTAVTSAPTEVYFCGAGFLRDSASRDIEFANELLRESHGPWSCACYLPVKNLFNYLPR